MSDFPYRSALIVGAGPGISASLARCLAAVGVKVALAARNVQKLDALSQSTGAQAFAADAANRCPTHVDMALWCQQAQV
jgi:NADP-dependent 3-hydroxy acid dehydrogenase YdfG